MGFPRDISDYLGFLGILGSLGIFGIFGIFLGFMGFLLDFLNFWDFLRIFRGGPSKSKQKPTAVNEHLNLTSHFAEMEDFEIIGRERSRNDFRLRVKESILIKKHAPVLNENEASTPLYLF